MSKGGSQSQTTTLDPASQAYVQQMRQYAMGAAGLPTGATPGTMPSGAPLPFGFGGMAGSQATAGWSGNQHQPGNPAAPFAMPGLPQGITDAQNQYQQYAQGGNLGFSALTGNADAASQFMNPYMSQMNPFWAQQRQQAVEGANQQATLAGAFGGDRSQIGAAAAGNFVDQNQAAAQIQAFQDAMQRAGFAANLGYGASAQSAFLPQQYYGGQLGLLNQGMGPYGQTQTTKTQGDPFSQLLGLGMMFLPGGQAAGLLGKGAGALPMVV